MGNYTNNINDNASQMIKFINNKICIKNNINFNS